MVITTRAEDAKVMFSNEGRTPVRPGFPALNILRKKLFNSGGLISELVFCYFYTAFIFLSVYLNVWLFYNVTFNSYTFSLISKYVLKTLLHLDNLKQS